ncbi:hypothetical protein [Scytonema millei]|uniref:Uncharacterized protein n=1 Tax=Scytonema millei VB511283 TaxID=1245923 RepID=A0A9X5I5M7_9CYAN|nr:hypothetical protein [Scytonema millei]NHC36195.1 hypothetical protein [Scytonema millei VB511283]
MREGKKKTRRIELRGAEEAEEAEGAEGAKEFKIQNSYTPQRQLLMGGTPKTALAPLHPFFTDN